MKHLKQYESFKDKLQVGDYILFYFNPNIGDEKLRTFFNTNIAQVDRIDEIDDKDLKNFPYNTPNPTINIKYENIPPELIDRFGKNYLSIALPKNAIVAWSNNKEDIETILSTNKYNI